MKNKTTAAFRRLRKAAAAPLLGAALTLSAAADGLNPATGEDVNVLPFVLGGIGLVAVVALIVLSVLDAKRQKNQPPTDNPPPAAPPAPPSGDGGDSSDGSADDGL